MLIKEVPFLRISLPMAVGIITGYYIKPGNAFIFSISLIALAVLAVSLCFNRRPVNVIFGISITLALFIAGTALYTLQKRSLSTLPEKEIIIMCTVSGYPEERERSYRFLASMNAIIENYNTEPLYGSVLLYLNKDSIPARFSPGDKLLIKFVPQEITNRGNPCEFDYRFYMENRGCRYYAFINEKAVIKHIVPYHKRLVHKALILRESVIGMYKSLGLNGSRLAIVSAITLGYRDMVDNEQKQEFIRAGVMHIMAVSGLHAGIVSLFVSSILFFLRKRLKWLRVIITLITLWGFAIVTGLSTSVMRASIMFSFLHAGGLMRRHVNSINSVLASSFIQMLIRPSVIFDSGFLLSYSAVIALICFYREFYLKLNFKNLPADRIWQASAVTIVAQLGTLPLTITLFNRFPSFFFIANIIIVPLVSVLVITGCLIPLIYPLRFISEPVAGFLNLITGIIETIVHKISVLPFSAIENIGMTGVECFFLSGFIFFFLYWLFKRESVALSVPLVFLLLFISAGTVKHTINKRSAELIVYNSLNTTCMAVRRGNVLHVSHNSAEIPPEALRHASVMGFRIKSMKTNGGSFSIQTGNIRICATGHLSNDNMGSREPVIFLLTGKKPYIDRAISKQAGNIEAKVISSEADEGFQIPENIRNELSGKLFYVKKSGAFRVRI